THVTGKARSLKVTTGQICHLV
ncbi:hypothetical protein ACH56_05230, partial [Salmonella enterica subsp. enterica serovar Infantis]